jgi:hypothetical protein
MAKSTSKLEAEIRAALAGLPVAVRGLWHEMRHLIEKQSDRPGHLQRNGRPISERQLAFQAGCNSKKVIPYLDELKEAGLIEKSSGCWHSDKLRRIAEGRAKRRELTSAWRAAGNDAPRARRRRRGRAAVGVSRDTQCDQRVTGAKRAAPAPSRSLSPTPPLSHPPTTPEIPVAAQPAAARAMGKSGRVAKGRARILSDEQLAVRNGFQEWWIHDAWPSAHLGVEYEDFDGGDAAAVLKLLRSKAVNWQLARAQALAVIYLKQPEMCCSSWTRCRCATPTASGRTTS